MPGCSRTDDVSTDVEADVPVSKRRAVVTRRLIPIACDGGRPASSSVPVLERSREMLDQAFDIGMAVFRCVSF